MPATPQEQLGRLREGIDDVDARIVGLLAERFRLTDEVGRLKAAHHLPAVDPGREAMQFERARRIASEAGLDGELAVRVLKQIIHESVERHLATAQASRGGV